MGGQPSAWLAVTASAVCASWLSAAAQAPPDLDALVAHVGDRVLQYYQRAQRVICVEQSTVQPIQTNWSADGFSRTVESELRVDLEAVDGDGLPEAKVMREVRRINGREPRERDKKNRIGCTDPTPLSAEPLTFLLPQRRHEYRFTSVRNGRDGDRAALIIDFMSASQASKPELIKDAGGHDDCFDWKGPVATRGRLWVDAATHDVLRVDRRLGGPTDVRVPWALQRSHGLPPWITIDRDDVTVRYSAVAFSDPEERLMLPESIDSMTVIRSGLQSVRRTDRFRDYRRFLTMGRISKTP